MRAQTESGIILTVRNNGTIECPYCRKGLIRIRPDTEARHLPIWCRSCSTELIVRILPRPERLTSEPKIPRVR